MTLTSGTHSHDEFHFHIHEGQVRTPVERWMDSPAATPAGSTAAGEVACANLAERGQRTHNMKAKHKKFGAVMMALAVLITGGVAAVTAAPGSIDPQTDSSSEVYISADKTMETDFNASGDVTWNLTVANVSDTARADDDLMMNVTHASSGVEYYSGTMASNYSDGDADSDSATGGVYHAFSNDELDDVPMNINQNVTLNVTYWNDSASSPSPTTVQVYVENGDERSVQRVTENASMADVEELSAPFYRPLADDYNSVEVDDTVDVNGTATDVIYTLSDSETQDPFSNVSEDVSSSGTFLFAQASVDGDESATVPMFYKSAPSWYDTDDHGSYMTYSPGDDTVTVNTEDTEFKDATTNGTESVDIQFTSDVYRIDDVAKVYKLNGGWDGNGGEAVIAMVM